MDIENFPISETVTAAACDCAQSAYLALRAYLTLCEELSEADKTALMSALLILQSK